MPLQEQQGLQNGIARSQKKAASVRVGPLTNIPAVLRDLGHDPAPIIDSKGFTLEQFKDPDYRLPFIPASKLLAHCVEITGCQHFGLLLAKRAIPSHLGVAGFLLQTASDVNTALQALQKYLDTHDEGGVLTLKTNNGTTQLGYAVHLADVEALEQIHDLSIAFEYNIMRALCGNRWKASSIMLMRAVPPDPSYYRKHFKAPVRFNAEESAVTFPSRWLSQPLSFADILLYQHLENEANEIHAINNKGLTAKLRQILRQRLTMDECNISNIANALNMHERTLNRQLKNEGTSFRHELEQIRYTVSQQLLTTTSTSIVDIATSLGYADATAFIRAFKRWSGTTPAQWRSHRIKH